MRRCLPPHTEMDAIKFYEGIVEGNQFLPVRNVTICEVVGEPLPVI
jgi:hypothetical protein